MKKSWEEKGRKSMRKDIPYSDSEDLASNT